MKGVLRQDLVSSRNINILVVLLTSAIDLPVLAIL